MRTTSPIAATASAALTATGKVKFSPPDPAAVPGGIASSPAAADADSCATDRKTLEVAIEAFFVSFGRVPANEQELVDAEMIREPFASYDVELGEVVPGDGSACP